MSPPAAVAVSGPNLRANGALRESNSEGKRPDDPDLVKARRDLKAARLEDYIKKTVDAAPPLSREQLDRLAILLRGGSPPGGSAATQPDLGANQEGLGGGHNDVA